MSIPRRIHRWLAWLFAAGILVQGYLAGAAMVELGGSGDFVHHIAFGYGTMGLLALGVLVSAVVSRATRAQIGLSVGLVGLYVVQTFLPSARSDAPVLAALHPLNAIVLFGGACLIAMRAGQPAAPAGTAGPERTDRA